MAAFLFKLPPRSKFMLIGLKKSHRIRRFGRLGQQLFLLLVRGFLLGGGGGGLRSTGLEDEAEGGPGRGGRGRNGLLVFCITEKNNKIIFCRSTWFTPASKGQVRVTRMAADPLNVRQQASRLDIRKKFYSQRVVDAWNKVPTDIKNSVTVSSFKKAYKKH